MGGVKDSSIRQSLWFAITAVVLAAVARFSIFSPLGVAELAYCFLIPLALPDWSQHSKRLIFLFGWISGFLFWLPSIIWLRHVTVFGTIGLSAVLAVFTGLWLLYFGRSLQPKWGDARGLLQAWRVPLLGAAFWVILEWSRTWVFWGFPWNPLSVSQANRPAVLSILPFTGGWGLSFLLVWINLALAQWLRSPFTRWEGKGYLPVSRRVPLVVMVPLGILLGSAGIYFWNVTKFVPSQPVRVGFVQPYATMKWEQSEVEANLRRVWEETRNLKEDAPEIILWPESATPVPVIGSLGLKEGVENLAAYMGVPILMGNMAFLESEGVYENGVFWVDPSKGLAEEYYVKRKLVPFGEFIPFRRYIPFVETFVPISLDCRPGERAYNFYFEDRGSGNEIEIGPLICYEDVFPNIARETVRAGADWLFVATNNSWYGEEAGAYQHANHAVIRAVENRRPVLRSGNGGWSGWIDEWGNIRREVVDNRGSIYFQGGEVVPIVSDLRFQDHLTFYVRWGNWFVWACITIVMIELIGRLLHRQNT